MEKISFGNKLPGKTEFSGRRRNKTRTSGFKSHPEATGGEVKILNVEAFIVAKGESVIIDFIIPEYRIGDIVAFGGWYFSDNNMTIDVMKGRFGKVTYTEPESGNWSKFGSISLTDKYTDRGGIQVKFTALKDSYLALYGVGCGIVEHKHLDWAKSERPVLLSNMHMFSPEANFYSVEGDAQIELSFSDVKNFDVELVLKSCNRCARFLPINVNNERHQLSFSNHCVAEHRRPCSHTGFGKLRNIESNETLQLEYGYQLECRYCKKYEVNAAHNPQRSPAQMKEDGARRRFFELLLTELYGGSPQLSYRINNDGRELADDIWIKFNKKCFNCPEQLSSSKDMHLDHTRPLALLWPLDETATCLCGSCNSAKRDRPPSEFYSEEKLVELSEITGIPLYELKNPTPNMDAIEKIKDNIDWLFNVFCQREELQKIRDGKLTLDLFLKALQKAINKTQYGKTLNLARLYGQRL